MRYTRHGAASGRGEADGDEEGDLGRRFVRQDMPDCALFSCSMWTVTV